MTEQSRLTVALTVSLLLHGLLLALLPLMRNLRDDVPRLPPLLDVDIASLPKLPPPPPAAQKGTAQAAPEQQVPPPQIPIPKMQIVSPPDAGEEKPPPDKTRLLSDRDNIVPEEKVHRSTVPNFAEAKPPPAAEKAAADKPAGKPEPPAVSAAKTRDNVRVRQAAADREPVRRSDTQVASLPRLDQLLPQPGDYAASAPSSGASLAAPTPGSNGDKRRLLMGGNREAFSTNRGISDFLPGIREGDITLLNTKAERFAPFVRRVAARVFQHLDIRLRQSVGNTVVRAGREYAVVEAVMSKKGRLLSARVVDRQSTSTLAADRILLGVTEPDTFFDENPPPGAEANDGNIHFILLIDLMVQSVQEPRTGRVVGGYHGMASVGLDTAPDERADD
ncbi:MAG: hypothetical protein HY270_22570 [Deltaproteobacteria bacterium]|nr:hypothetical protein [Deltaproteobacteria bacterium]